MRYVTFTRVDIDLIRNFDKKHAPHPPKYHIDTVDELRTEFYDPSFISYGVYIDNELAGQISYLRNQDDSYYLNAIVVHTAYRQKGLGSKMLNKIKKEIQAKGGKHLWLTISPENKKAITFYKKNGFTIEAFRKNVYGEGEDRLYMELEL